MSFKRKSLLVAKLCFCLVSAGVIYGQSATAIGKVSEDPSATAACPKGCVLLPHGVCAC
jgi:hypothetical protein